MVFPLTLQAKDLYETVPNIETLVSLESYDDRNVAVVGNVVGWASLRGRMGGKYFIVYLSDISRPSEELIARHENKYLAIVFPLVSKIPMGTRVLALGKFERKGKVGGRLFYNFMREPTVHLEESK